MVSLDNNHLHHLHNEKVFGKVFGFCGCDDGFRLEELWTELGAESEF